MKIVIVEDDPGIRKELKQLLENAFYEAEIIEEFKDTAEQICSMIPAPDLVLLDWNLPGESGFDICTKLKEHSDIPIIFLTSRTDSMDELTGILKGADDYITKPFSPKELVLRVNNIIKRAYRDDNNRISIDGYELDEEQRKIYADNVEIELTTKEFDLLMMFIKNKGIAFSRDKILENVWDENYFGSDRVVDDTLRRLRKKLPNLNIHTIYGYGYRLG